MNIAMRVHWVPYLKGTFAVIAVRHRARNNEVGREFRIPTVTV